MTTPTPETLSAPAEAPGQALQLQAPPALKPVPATQAPAMAPAVPEERMAHLDARVDQYLAALSESQPKSPTFEKQTADIRTMGDQDIRKAAEMSNTLLDGPVKRLNSGVAGESEVGKSLQDLRRTVEDLDPEQAKGVKKLLGMIPMGNKVTDYFRKYESAQDHLDGILKSLKNGQNKLQQDNIALTQEKHNLWASMGMLNQYIYMAERLDAKVSAQIAELDASDPEKAKALREDVLFYVRQKHQDLITQLAVSIQNYLAIDIIIKNNIELIKGVDRASTTTVSALRTAVIVAQAMNNQKLVLQQISALNETTSTMIQRTSELLRDNSVEIQKQAASATIGLPELQAAFQNIYQTMNAIDSFRSEALDSMATTIGTLESEVAKSNEFLARVQKSDERPNMLEI